MAKNITKSITVGTSPVNIATALGLDSSVACTELFIQNDLSNSTYLYFGQSDVSPSNSIKYAAGDSYTERAAGNEPIQLGDMFVLCDLSQRVNIHARI